MKETHGAINVGVDLKPGDVGELLGNSLHICTKILNDRDKFWDRDTAKDLEFH